LNADRLANRFWDYPRTLRRMRDRFDLFHIVDHSYAQLVHELPPGRAVVTCHDLDTFRCVLEPEREPRGRAFRAMVGRTLAGFRAAARVLCVSGATRDAVLAHGLLPPERVVVAPNGVHPSCTTRPDPEADAEAERLLGVRDARVPVVLHVGSTIARKRLDVLLRLYAELRRVVPGVCLARVGGFTPEQGRLRAQLGLDGAVRELPPLDRRVLAAVYRRASVLVQPSESEGFGLPVVEAMACGTPVVASEIAVLREVGGAAATYCPVGDVPRWTAAVEALLAERAADPEGWARRRAAAVARAGVFSWSENARRTVEVYMEVLGSAPA
ncbi:MAG TPA: glycosyltransferase family 1 protein, partial [Gemmatimonadaceae bacterium]|nr:glycosyltransferase family 1 protein [Gemmatimonadaceae bacterium]